MPNKTLYVREADIPLWNEAQDAMGVSISALFAEFLRERLAKMDAFVHVVRATPNSDQFAVMIAPTESVGAPMRPAYINGFDEVSRFLQGLGVRDAEITELRRGLRAEQTASVRTAVIRSAPGAEYYRLQFRPTGNEIDAVGLPVSAGQKQWRARFTLDELMNALVRKVGLPKQQLTAIRQSLLAGTVTELGGVTGAPYAISDTILMNLGMTEVDF